MTKSGSMHKLFAMQFVFEMLLRHILNLLSPEELIGLEQKIADTSGVAKYVESRAHTICLLKRQEKLRNENAQVDVEQLAEVAAVSSSRNVQKARARAALAKAAWPVTHLNSGIDHY